MKAATLLLALASLAAPMLLADALQSTEELSLGSKAPSLSCLDTQGNPIILGDRPGKATIVYFHTNGSSQSRQALEQLCSSLISTSSLEAKVNLVVAVKEQQEIEGVVAACASTGAELRITVPSRNELQIRYGVIAYPSAYILDAEQQLLSIVRGHGPLFAFKVIAATRLSLGMVTEAEYEARLAGKQGPRSADELKALRIITIARRLIHADKEAMAITVLRQKAQELEETRVLKLLLVRLLLRANEFEEASDVLAGIISNSPEKTQYSVYLAELAVARGKVAEAASILDVLPSHDPRIRLVRGQILAVEGKWEAAAALYKDGLEMLLMGD